jgi:predicted ATPase
MFADLVGSTTLSEQLDPEDLREVVRAYQQTSAKIIERYAGHIAQYLGDGLLVYFGYPTAHEDDAARAVRAGLEIVTALQKWVPSPLVGEGQVVLLSGEPGIGKSRLGQELKEQLSQEGTIRIEFRCSPYHQNSALYPVIKRLQRVLRIEREDSAQVKLGKLEQALSHYRFLQADTLPLLAALLSLPHPTGVPPLALSPEQQKEKTLQVLVRWFCEETERHAVYCAWEDLHWADPSTLELLALYLDQVPTMRMLALLTFRPEFLPPWGSRSYFSQLSLGRLGRAEVERIVENVAGGRTLPDAVVEQVVAKMDGVPLFVEELTKTVIESGIVQAVNSHYELTAPLSPLAIPATLHDSLMARLDRLAEAKAVAQLGATLGREFSYKLLQAVSSVDEATLQHGLAQLVDAELVYQRGMPPHAHYIFKHALVQDTAYQSLLKRERQRLHQEIAQVLVDRFLDTAATQPELVAHHYTEAGLVEQAIPYWQKAGERDVNRSAYVEGISHLSKGLELLKTLPDTAERSHQEMNLQIPLGLAFMATKNYAAPEVGQAYTQARELYRQAGETPQLAQVLYGWFTEGLDTGDLREARALLDELA